MSKCIFCGGKATLLCDSNLGWERKRGAMAKEAPTVKLLHASCVPLRYRMVHKCDAPLCEACAIPDGVMHIRTKMASFSDSIDYCPGHGFGTLVREINGLQAEQIRSKWRASARANRFVPAAQSLLAFETQ